MYRIIILASTFLLAIAGLLFLQGGDEPPALAPLTEASALSAPDDIVLPEPSETAQALAAVLDGADPQTGAPTGGVLAQPETPDTDMQAMTAQVLAGLNLATGAALGPQAGDLASIVAQALRAGQSDAYIDALVNEAAAAGQLAVPGALITADGKVDTRAVLAGIVAEASHQPAPAAAEARDYVVEPGDSLAYISVLFYGSPTQVTRIYEANRDRLASPDKIRVGQTLRIPG